MPVMNSSYSLHNCSCFDLFPKLARGSIDLVLCDPPYGSTRLEWDNKLPTKPLWGGLQRVTKPNAAIVLMSAQPYTSELITSNLDDFRYVWTWFKPNCNSLFLSCKIRPLSAIEDLIVFYSKQPTYNPQMESGKPYFATRRSQSSMFNSHGNTCHTNNKGGRYPKNFIKLSHSVTNRANETQKPVELMEYMIKTYTNPGDKVLDFTMGSGTTGVACANLGRKFVGCEIDRSQFVGSRARVSQAYQKALQIEPSPQC